MADNPFSQPASAQRGRWYMLAILTLFVIISYIDRLVLSLLVTPLKADLGLSDMQISLLLGLSFALFYGLVSIPAGYLVDRFPRRYLLLGAVLIWTSLTLLSGLATNFTQLLICRAGVGLGEALLAPAAYSLINQSFGGKARSWAFTIFSLGNAVGGGIAMLLIGGLLSALDGGMLSGLAAWGSFEAWQMVLILLGAAGIPLSFLLLTFREPEREEKQTAADDFTMTAALAHLWQNRSNYGPLYGANFCIGVAIFGAAAWAPTMMERQWGIPISQIGQVFGSIQMVMSFLGLVAGGWILQWLHGTSRQKALPLVGVVAFSIGAVGFAFAPHMPLIAGSWVMLGIALFMLPCSPVLNAMILTDITPPRMIGKFSALVFLVVSAFGTAVGPTLIALLSEHGFSGPKALGGGFSLGVGIPLLGAATLYGVLAIKAQRGKLQLGQDQQ